MTKDVTIEYLHSYLSGIGAKFGEDRLSDVSRQIRNYNNLIRNDMFSAAGLRLGRDSYKRIIWE